MVNQLIFSRPPKILRVALIATCFWMRAGALYAHDDMMERYWQQENAYQTERVADALENQQRTVVINDAGEGCYWARYVDKKGRQKTLDSTDGYRRKIFVRICEDDPKIP